MSDHELESSDTPVSSTFGAPDVAATPPSALPVGATGLRDARRVRVSVIAAVALLVALLGASVFAAQRLNGGAALAPEASLVSSIAHGAPMAAQGNGATTSVTSSACQCASKHSSYVPSPYKPSGVGQVVIVSISKQQLWAYQNGQLVMTSLVTTGMPQLPTPQGTFHIMMKEQNVWFYSPWPYGSPYYYSPEHINYAMLFRAGGFYIHDAPWRKEFGPGTNVPHYENGKLVTGSHGCVNMPTPAAAQLYSWIGIGATVIIRY